MSYQSTAPAGSRCAALPCQGEVGAPHHGAGVFQESLPGDLPAESILLPWCHREGARNALVTVIPAVTTTKENWRLLPSLDNVCLEREV